MLLPVYRGSIPKLRAIWVFAAAAALHAQSDAFDQQLAETHMLAEPCRKERAAPRWMGHPTINCSDNSHKLIRRHCSCQVPAPATGAAV